jgi:hypothetical protein
VTKAVWLFRVFDAFNVKGNGWVLVPGVPRDGPTVKAGDAIELRGGKGPTRTATVRAVGVFGPSDQGMPLLIDLDPTDRPLLIGAEVWLVPRPPAD